MEIYKLSDEVPEGERRRESGSIEKRISNKRGRRNSNDDGKLVITELKAGVKNPERVNVYVNSQFAFSLDVAQVVDYKLKIGAVLSREQLVELKKASEFGKIYQRTLEWVLMRPRSIRETKDYLFKKLKSSSSETLGPARRYGRTGAPPLLVSRGSSSEDDSELLNEIIHRLLSKGYLDDRRFAEFWVENRFVKKGVSKKRLKMELMKKGIAMEIIEEVLDGRDDEDELRKMIARKKAKYDDPQKLVAYLCRQGFSYDLVKELVGEE